MGSQIMEKSLNKVKTGITALWVVIISFPYKIINSVAAQSFNDMQTFYWVMSPDILIESSEPSSTISTISSIINIMRFSQILLAAIVFIVWIINLIKIRKINDKALKQNTLKKTSIVILIAVIVIFLLSLWARLIKKYTA